MDDNKILTLANNDRIPMLRPNVTLQMEVEDLRNASPATVSRAGVIFISSNDLGWRPVALGYLKKRRKAEVTPCAPPPLYSTCVHLLLLLLACGPLLTYLLTYLLACLLPPRPLPRPAYPPPHSGLPAPHCPPRRSVGGGATDLLRQVPRPRARP